MLKDGRKSKPPVALVELCMKMWLVGDMKVEDTKKFWFGEVCDCCKKKIGEVHRAGDESIGEEDDDEDDEED